DGGLAVEFLQAFPGKADDLFRRYRRLQTECHGGIIDARRMSVEVGGDTLEPASAVEDAGAEPHHMAARSHERHIALMPITIDIGPGLRLGGGIHFHSSIHSGSSARCAMEGVLRSIVNRHGITNRSPDIVAPRATRR